MYIWSYQNFICVASVGKRLNHHSRNLHSSPRLYLFHDLEQIYSPLWKIFPSVESQRGDVAKFWYPQMQNAKEDPVSWRAIIYGFFLLFWRSLSCKSKDLASFSLLKAYFCWKKWCVRFRFVKTCRKDKSTLFMCACNFSNGKIRLISLWLAMPKIKLKGHYQHYNSNISVLLLQISDKAETTLNINLFTRELLPKMSISTEHIPG